MLSVASQKESNAPIISTEQRRIIDYWKSRVKLDYWDHVAREQLTKEFAKAGAETEQLAFWRERVNEGGSGVHWCATTLVKTFEAKGDFGSILEFWKSEIRRPEVGSGDEGFIEVVAWESLVGMLKCGALADSEVVSLCKLRMARQKESMSTATYVSSLTLSTLSEHLANTHPGTRIGIWKSILHTNCLYTPVRELQRALIEKGLEKGGNDHTIDFWKLIVRNYPPYWHICDALQDAFSERGLEQAAKEFWVKMAKRYPDKRVFAHFVAESSKAVGDYETAIQTWTTWLEKFLSDNVDSYEDEDDDRIDDKFNEEQILNNLDEAFSFERNPSEVIDFWETLRKKYPVKPQYPVEKRQRSLATALLDHSRQLPPSDAMKYLKQALIEDPSHHEAAVALSDAFQSTGDMVDEENFWSNEARDFIHTSNPWPHLRLAKHCSSRGDVGLALASVNNVEFGGIDEDDEVWKALDCLKVGDSVKFWHKIVLANPCHGSVKRLKREFEAAGKKNMVMWKHLIWKHPSSYNLATTFQEYNTDSQSTIEFWIETILRHPNKTVAYYYLETALKNKTDAASDSYKISIWKSIFREMTRRDELNNQLPKYLNNAYKEMADSTTDLNTLKDMWNDAKKFWRWILEAFVGSNPEFISTVEKYFDRATAYVRALDDGTGVRRTTSPSRYLFYSMVSQSSFSPCGLTNPRP